MRLFRFRRRLALLLAGLGGLAALRRKKKA